MPGLPLGRAVWQPGTFGLQQETMGRSLEGGCCGGHEEKWFLETPEDLGLLSVPGPFKEISPDMCLC